MKQTLFSATKGTGTQYDKVIEQEPHLKKIAEKSVSDSFDELIVKWYMKTGIYCKMDINQFLDSPYKYLKLVTKELDKKLENYSEEIIDYNHFGIMVALSKLFGGK